MKTKQDFINEGYEIEMRRENVVDFFHIRANEIPLDNPYAEHFYSDFSEKIVSYHVVNKELKLDESFDNMDHLRMYLKYDLGFDLDTFRKSK